MQDTQTITLAACSTNSSQNAAHGQKPESILQKPKEATERLTESTFSREEVRIVVVCALPLEADAVCALFDKPCDADLSEMKAPRDTNAYTFGIIGRHPTVVVHMPGMGKTNGAITATKCQSSFPNVKLALVVGICGGVPFYDKGRKEIILGDVIISEGLIAYDFGRRFPDSFVTKNSPGDAFARPPVEVRSLLNKLKCRADLRRFRERTCEHLAFLRQSPDCQAVYPGATEDQLFEGTYVHRHNNPDACQKCSNPANVSNSVCDQARSSSCEELSCDKAKLVPRRRLEDIMRGASVSVPAVHFGYIACGDQVMKSGEHRDRIAEENGVIAFEMEGAGVWDTFPCLVIKAVCDYADSHKHKKWQDYAAATAAACAKAFLQEWHI
ncbi:PFS domain-containing protein (phosphorylase superfamily protein) [Colletotrichum truncatum]|uniref:PFS domain-containing protein (Phosphorylase superfamily protein) n=1 Tax=Colletotrichum truncatum TaxID=5467 RepID=A0ACC3Z064_COLTU|nr:PFS domain-containing protein (phosphorylase superfamily protein) [Colletotrichum truncatum]KAF6800752.1 PFS domain-containing protein (phosphorylase superfamily protein) [Colletotrichum truncatum]